MAQRTAGKLAPHALHYARIGRAFAVAGAAMIAWLAIGTVFYHGIEDLAWIDAFHQSALLLSGMGPVVDIKSTAGKIFDGFYALFCGVILLASTGLMFAPVIHRILHRFHLEDARDR